MSFNWKMKQHFVPRCYLKRFSDNERSIFAYDKTTSKSYIASLMSVCCENDMYSLSDECVKKTKKEEGQVINNLSIEKDHFAQCVEPMYAQLLAQIDDIKDDWVTGKGQYRLCYNEKLELALHIATQYLRHPLIGEAEVDNYLRFEQASMDLFKHILANQTGNEGLDQLKIKIECEKSALHARMTYMDYDELMKCAEVMANNIFVFWVSRADDFYTSDFPVMVEPHVKDVGNHYCGLVQYGGEILMSLSPSLALSIFDRDHFKDKDDMDSSFVIADDKEIRRHNLMRYFYAQRHVFSYRNDFSLIENFYQLNGRKHIFMTPHLKAEIVSGLGRY